MQTPKDIVAALGRDQLREALSVGSSTISEALSSGLFPASWYAAIKRLADARGLDVPMSAFRWKDAARGRDDVVAPSTGEAA